MAIELQTLPRPRTRLSPVPHIDTEALAAELRRDLRGGVRFDRGERALYATDASNYRQIPLGVVYPVDADDVEAAVAVARRHRAPLLPRGGGTSLAGQSCNTAVVLDLTRHMQGVLEIDAGRRRARVLAGTYLDALREAARPHGLTFGPDPATHSHCAIGGMIGNNSCGVHSVLSEFYGPGPHTADQLHEMEVLLYDGTRLRVGRTPPDELERIIAAGGRRGEVYSGLRDLVQRHADRIRERYPPALRNASGYNLPALLPENGFHVARALAGSEGTCALVLEATLELIEEPAARALAVLGYPTVYDAADHVPRLRELRPIAIEGMDDVLTYYMDRKGLRSEDIGLLPDGSGWLLVEFGGRTQEEASARAREAMDALGREAHPPTMQLHEDPRAQARLWHVRESGLGATAFIPDEPDNWPGWEDSAVPPEQLGDYLRDLRALLDRHGYGCSFYGHFGQGLVHTRIDFDLSSAEGIERMNGFLAEAAELVTGEYGGALSGEHGDGQARGDMLERMYGPEMVDVFREFRRIWDPEARMNPGKVVDAYAHDANLRLGADYRPATPQTHFRFPEDQGSFARAALRCVGVGKCRRHEGGTMCPSYQVLREEKHTTRGRAHLLWEMLQGEAVTDGWRSEDVHEALDLCLSCKGCKGECPVNVDIATYKAEFLSHYYEGRVRPRAAYAFGLIDVWAQLASLAPGLANLFTQTPGLARLAKAAANVAPERQIPRFARRTFRDWWSGREPRNPTGTRVLLWPDTFNDHFYPQTLAAAVEVLEDAGCRVVVPERRFCCGRPLYEFGMLVRAKRYLREILRGLREEIEASTPVIVLEPSCLSVFRDELRELFPNDRDARRLASRACTLAEFLIEDLGDRYEPPTLARSAVVHGHCHHRSVLNFGYEEDLLRSMGVDYRTLDSGCCGMAGSFGFEKGEKHAISVQRAAQALLPAIEQAGEDALVLTDGFSCREQIRQLGGRHALHVAEALQLALRGDAVRLTTGPAEAAARAIAPRELAAPTSPTHALAGLGAGLLAGGLLAWHFSNGR